MRQGAPLQVAEGAPPADPGIWVSGLPNCERIHFRCKPPSYWCFVRAAAGNEYTCDITSTTPISISGDTTPPIDPVKRPRPSEVQSAAPSHIKGASCQDSNPGHRDPKSVCSDPEQGRRLGEPRTAQEPGPRSSASLLALAPPCPPRSSGGCPVLRVSRLLAR